MMLLRVVKIGRVLLFLIAVGAFAQANAIDAATSLYEQGQKAFERHDLRAAMENFEKAALLDHSPSQVRLGWILDGIGEHEAAVKLYRKAATSDHPEAQYLYGEKLLAGEGTEKNETVAVQWITKAAVSGHPAAIRRLVIAHESGELGLPRDANEAVNWLRRGVTHSDRWSIQRLADAYQKGELGLAVDENQFSRLSALLGTD